MKQSAWVLRGLLLIGLSLLTSGCVSRLCRYEVRLTMADTMRDSRGVVPNTDVHLVALNPLDSERLNRIGPTKYWDPSRQRLPFDEDKCVLQFGGELSRTGELTRDNPLWRRWSRAGAVNLFILANLRLGDTGAALGEDPGREVIPLKRTRWWFRRLRIIDAWVDRNGLGHDTPRLPWEQRLRPLPDTLESVPTEVR